MAIIKMYSLFHSFHLAVKAIFFFFWYFRLAKNNPMNKGDTLVLYNIVTGLAVPLRMAVVNDTVNMAEYAGIT